MNEIILNNTDMPVVNLCNHLIAHKSFYHKDRIAPFHILIYVIKGTIYVTEDKIDYEIHPGELIFLKSGIRHYGKQKIKIGTEWHFVHFCYDMPADSICNNTCTRTLPKTLSGLSGSKLASHIAAFSKYAASENAYHQWNLNAELFRLLSEIAFFHQHRKTSDTLSEKICTFLEENYKKPFSSAMLEEKFFLSYKYMALVFKKEKQMTMQQFHTMIRMENACRLLKHTMLPIGEISQMVGYQDKLYFSKCFHTYMQMSPTAYRKLPEIY